MYIYNTWSKNTFSSLQMVAKDSLIPPLISGLSCWIWPSIHRNIFKKASSLAVNVEKPIRIFSTQLSSAFYEYRTVLCSQILISFMHSIQKMVKQTLKTLQCLHQNIFKSMKWLRNRCYISTVPSGVLHKRCYENFTKFIVLHLW